MLEIVTVQAIAIAVSASIKPVFTMRFQALDRQSRVPIYRQIAEQIRLQISNGTLPSGTRLPTVRELAATLTVTRLTVQNAYRDLQADHWIESTVGRGTYVTGSVDTQTIMEIVGQHNTAGHIMNDLSRMAHLVGVRSMAFAEPDPVLYPVADFMQFFSHPSANDGSLLQYGSAQGDEMLRVGLVKLLTDQHIVATADDIIITAGVTQGLALLVGSVARPGDVIAVEQPVYLGMLHTLNAYGLSPIGVPIDNEGIRLDRLEKVLQTHQPRFLYTIPSFQNPTGTSMSPQRRRDLLDLARRYDLMIVEDDIYGLMAYDGPPPMPLKAYDTTEQVVYLNSLSKTLMPGLRIGYMVVPPHLREKLVLYRQAQDLSSPLLLQRAVANFLQRGRFKSHIERVLPHYRARRDELLRSLAQYMPTSVQWTKPAGGFCCWLSLPRLPANFQHMALQHGMAFTPGDVFLSDSLSEPDNCSHIRLCFASLPPDLIREAVIILGSLLDQGRIPAGQHIPGFSQQRPLV